MTSDNPYQDPLAIEFIGDPGKELQRLFIKELMRRLRTPDVAASLTAAELEVCRKVIESNAIDLNSIRRGEFGKLAKDVADKFPAMDGQDAPPFDAQGNRVN